MWWPCTLRQGTWIEDQGEGPSRLLEALVQHSGLRPRIGGIIPGEWAHLEAGGDSAEYR